MSDSDKGDGGSGDDEPKRPLEEIEKELEEKCLSAFMEFDTADAGEIASDKVIKVFEIMGIDDDQDEIFRFLSDIDPENTGIIKYSDFKPRIMERQMEKIRAADDTDELLDAYVAMGGDEDGGGCIDADKLISTIKEEFGMTIDIEKLIEEVDEDGSGEIEFEEFVELLSGS